MDYSFRKCDDSDEAEILNDQQDVIGTVQTVTDAETLVEYLNAGEGCFTAAALRDDGIQQWAFVIDDCWVAYTSSETSIETILSHLNRNCPCPNERLALDKLPDTR